MIAQLEGEKHGCQQVIFKDPNREEAIEELGGMNMMAVHKDGHVETPSLTGNILPGVTRRSLIQLLQDKGHYVAAVVDPIAVPEGRGRDYQQRSRDSLEKKYAGAPAQFGKTAVVAYDPAKPVFGPASSADVVLTFRNVHNWRKAGQAQGMFQGFFNVLKPGGVLGVVEHRAKADVADDDDTGYVGQQQVIAMAEAAGFKLDARSEVNANPRDTKDHPNGVWTLPPTNQHDKADDAKYQAIGESDRMTLRFIKP
ncbi:MAG: hypothetical protein DI592_15295 [Stenotrophomonas maltophilia]|nr:MAG: hypothetical protein DI592_15295 [Stenotrophomonas maltophilia]